MYWAFEKNESNVVGFTAARAVSVGPLMKVLVSVSGTFDELFAPALKIAAVALASTPESLVKAVVQFSSTELNVGFAVTVD
jgi:hypothetical protein